MRLLELQPRWVESEGRRVGFVFRNPVRAKWWVSCFLAPMPDDRQEALLDALALDYPCQRCNPEIGWKLLAPDVTTPLDPAAADFATLTVTPSLDGGPNFWHGCITKGEIV
jgi:hypothetical protein